METRPISDRAKGALFNILSRRVPGSRVLDLFAGTGGIGIEALSRGAAHATFVDLNRHATELIQKNLAKAHLALQSTVVRGDALAYVKKATTAFDLIFVAPPQWKLLWQTSLEALDRHIQMLAPDGVVVLQCDPKEYRPLPLAALQPTDQRKYGNVMLCFFRGAAA